MIRKIIGLSVLSLALISCETVEQRGAMVGDGMIENPSLGFFGFSFAVPEGFELYNPAARNPAEYSELQNMTIRVYDLNKAYHPRGNELFYESFLMLSENTGFLLITLKLGRAESFDGLWPSEDIAPQWQLMPLYNVRDAQRVTLGKGRLDATVGRGTAYERKGWYYSKPRSNRMPFVYESCKVNGVNGDAYILMGFSLPEHEHILSLQKQEMMRGFRF